MEQVKKLEPKFKVGDIVYYYNFGTNEIKKDEVARTEWDNNTFYYSLKKLYHFYILAEFARTEWDNNTFYYSLKKLYPFYILAEYQLFEAFDECKNHLLKILDHTMETLTFFSDSIDSIDASKSSLEHLYKKIKGQVEAL